MRQVGVGSQEGAGRDRGRYMSRGRSLGVTGETGQTDEHIPITRLFQADSGKTRCDDTPLDLKSASASPSTMDLPRYFALMCFRLSGRRQAENGNGNGKGNGGRRIVCVVCVPYACDEPVDSLVLFDRCRFSYITHDILHKVYDILYITHDIQTYSIKKYHIYHISFKLFMLWIRDIVYKCGGCPQRLRKRDKIRYTGTLELARSEYYNLT